MNPTAMTPTTLSRRGLLRLGSAAAAGTALHPFVPFLNSDAEAAGFPRRLLLYFMPLGTYVPMWQPSGTDAAFKLGAAMAPLEPYRSKLIVLDGMDNMAVTGGPGKRGHPGVNSLFTGAPHGVGVFNSGGSSGFGWAQGPSVDQFVAADLAKTAPLLKNSMQVGCNLDGTYFSTISFKGADQPVAPVTDPQSVYRSLFADLQLAPGKLAAIVAARKSVIDTVTVEMQRVRTRIPVVDRPKLDAHLANLRVIEGKLSVAASSACGRVPPAPAPVPAKDIPGTLSAHMDMVSAAFACNLTRVAAITAGKEQNGLGPPTWLGISESHHPISHRTDAAGHDLMVRIYAWCMTEIKLLLDRLAAVPEGNGTMLDNTVVVCASTMGDTSGHSNRGVPVFLAGSCGGVLRTGRVLKFGNYQPGMKDADYGGQSINNLHVSLCNAMGVPVTTFGDKRFCTGPLPGLL